ncbi:MAG: phospho-N-acetylmuramoyl-pentapeptide-transferase [Gammaproteobacteria bacterium]|nr:phospho-N-acetylmuramoyl-pentapeptide-transferase [Gammaproteobacteria bacterium]
MFLFFADQLTEFYSAFNALTYITTRGILSALTALLVSFVLGPKLIQKLSFNDVGESIRQDGPESHSVKEGTPTMGGLLILFSIIISTVIWGDFSSRYIFNILLVIISFGLIGFFDDYMKLQGNSDGLKPITKLLLQIFVAFSSVFFLFSSTLSPVETELVIPYTNNLTLQMGWFFVPFSIFVVVGSSNAVNLTDGLDGLAIMPTVMIATALGIFAYVAGNINISDYLGVPYIRDAGEVFIICAAIAGSGLGFLWFNTYPAQVFMGDVGALSLGAALGLIAVIIRQELVLAVMGGVFILETISVILQVGSFKLTGRRIFNMAPIHHHFELKGWAEPKVIVRFWIITVILVLIGLASLKLR